MQFPDYLFDALFIDSGSFLKHFDLSDCRWSRVKEHGKSSRIVAFDNRITVGFAANEIFLFFRNSNTAFFLGELLEGYLFPINI